MTHVHASDTSVDGPALPDPFDAAPPPSSAALEQAVSIVERRACESPDAVSVLVEVAGTECGWWLLSELVAADSDSDVESESESGRDGTTPDPDRRGESTDTTPRDPLVESLARFTRRSAEDVFKVLHTRLLPKLLVTDMVEHVGSVAAPPNYDVTVELRSDDDREFVSAVLFLVAVEAELVYGTREFSAAVRAAVRRFSQVAWRIQESSRRASVRASDWVA